EVRRDDRSSLGRDRRLLPAGEQGLARLRRGAQQQNPGDPAARLRLAQRRVSAAQNSHLHAASAIVAPQDCLGPSSIILMAISMAAALDQSCPYEREPLWNDGQRKRVAHMPTAITTTATGDPKIGLKSTHSI